MELLHSASRGASDRSVANVVAFGVGIFFGSSAIAELRSCDEIETFQHIWESPKYSTICYWFVPELKGECEALIETESSKKSLSGQDRFLVAEALVHLEGFEKPERSRELLATGTAYFESIHRDYPNNITATDLHYIFMDNTPDRDRKRKQLFKWMLDFPPACSPAYRHLIGNWILTRKIAQGLENVERMYPQITDVVWKLKLGAMLYGSYRDTGKHERATSIKERVARDLALNDPKFDLEKHDQYLIGLCDLTVLELGFGSLCMELIGKAVQRDVTSKHPIRESAVKAIRNVSEEIRNVRERAEAPSDEFAIILDGRRPAISYDEALDYASQLAEIMEILPADDQRQEFKLARKVIEGLPR